METLEREAVKYRAVWEDKRYREVSPGMRHLDHALEWLKPAPGSTFTDWGCGTGRAADVLFERGFEVRLVDIAPNAYVGALPFTSACLWSLPDTLDATDYGFCADVMEHIPTEYVDDAFAGIAARTRKGCYFQIALFNDLHFTANGPLHLSVFPNDWWRDKIANHFSSAEFKMIKSKHLLAAVKP